MIWRSIIIGLLLSSGIVALDASAAVDEDGLRGGELPNIAAKWVAGPESLKPLKLKGARGGVGFACPRALRTKRCYWDREVDLDLSEKEVFELEIFFPEADNIEQISLHFKSGKGWYSSSLSLADISPKVLVLRRDQFKSEGEPAAWSRIERMRISIWRSSPGAASMHLYRFIASVPKVVILKGADGLARKCADLVENWLLALGLSSRTVREVDLCRDILKNRELAILPCNPGLNADSARMLADFVDRGGRLFVFYSDNAILAKAMDVKLGGFEQAPQFRPWNRFEFASRRDASFPSAVYQRATAVLPAYPRGSDGRILAVWRSGGAGGDEPPALVQTRHGFWMTQVPKKFHAVAKKQMMAGALIRLIPEEASGIVRNMIEFSGQVDSFRNPAQTSLTLRKAANSSRAEAQLRRADVAYRAAQQAAADRRYEQSLAASVKVRAELEDAYVRIHHRKRDGLRGVWDHYGTGLYPGDWKRTCSALARGGINTLFVNMLNGGTAHYRSKVLAPSKTMLARGDQIAACLPAARQAGIAVHIWKVCWKIDGAPDGFVDRMEGEGRLQIDSGGKTLRWLNPAHPANRRMAIESIEELIRNYDIDGIQLDYIRYNWRTPDCSPYTRQAFSSSIGTEIPDWPAAILPDGSLHKRYERWRVERISSFVAEARRAIDALDPDVQLSAAVWGGYPECVETVCQDWVDWLRSGSVDFVVPMNYSDSIDYYSELLAEQSRLPNAAGKIYPGIGVTSSQSSLAPSDVVEQINISHSHGFNGYVLFDLDAELEKVVLPLMEN